VKVFIKNETTNNFTDVRNISPRTDEFLSIVGPYISAFEHSAKDLPFLIKGLDCKGRDKKMSPLLEYSDFLEVDFARFDMSISHDLLVGFEHYIFGSHFPKDAHPLFHQCLSFALTTNAINDYKCGYFIEGSRCSGDAWTSIGNGLLNHFVTWMCLRKIGQENWTSFHEGDDGIIGLKTGYLEQAKFNMCFLDCIGLRAKIDVYHTINDASFCGRFLTEVRGKLISYCDPYRTITKFHTTVSLGDPKYLLAAKANSYYHNDGHTPVVGALTVGILLHLLPQLHPEKVARYLVNVRRDLPWHYQMLHIDSLTSLENVKVCIDDTLRSAFYIRTGMTPREQIQWERYYLNFGVNGIPSKPRKMRVEWSPLPFGKWIPWRSNNWIV